MLRRRILCSFDQNSISVCLPYIWEQDRRMPVPKFRISVPQDLCSCLFVKNSCQFCAFFCDFHTKACVFQFHKTPSASFHSSTTTVHHSACQYNQKAPEKQNLPDASQITPEVMLTVVRQMNPEQRREFTRLLFA